MALKMYSTVLKQTAVALIVLMTVYSCSLIPKQVDVISKPIDRQIAQPVLPRGIDLKEPYWYVVSEKNIDEFLDKLKKEEGRVVFVAMSIPDYELMSYNMQELKRYINELKEVVVYYRKVTTKEAK
tara:strand:+ start:1176 stop:1553 length:378 start_codon:yes stop_codon:yes gene_type:complete